MTEEQAGSELPTLNGGNTTLGEVLDATPALQKLITLPLRGAVALRVARLIRAVDVEATAFETARIALVKTLGEQVEDDGPTNVKPENLAEFAQQFNEMRAEVFALPISKLKGDDLGDSLVSAGDLLALAWLFEE